jgi:heme-degrading monooxygenase HmoA
VIARTWTGRVPAPKADDYYDVLLRTGVSDYRSTPGFRGILVLRRIADGVALFTLTTLWDSIESIKAFAGDDCNRARYYPEDDEFLTEREPYVAHGEILLSDLPASSVPAPENQTRLPDAVRDSLLTLLRELLHGPPGDTAFALNPGDRGLLASLDALSAEAASARPNGRASVAAHVDHLRYGFVLINRWLGGEENPWAEADYSASWRLPAVDEDGWRELRAQLAGEAEGSARAWREPRNWQRIELTGAIASIVHLAYHLGAIRQLQAAAAGPKAGD